jgi:GNAT superfamily N-acetyltransferase
MAVVAHSLASSASNLRPFNARRDLRTAVDLVGLCFAGTLDPDGQNYLRQLGEMTSGGSFLAWAWHFGEPASLPLTGYVWEEDGRLVGYLSLIPFQSRNRRCYLIANVAVHPDYRGRGIGRALTVKALEYAHDHHAQAAWLQVRENNAPAVHVYRSLGFIECARRTTWTCEGQGVKGEARRVDESVPLNDIPTIGPRRSDHWLQQRAWLDRLYPADLAWHLPLDRKALEPGLTGSLYRFFALVYPRHWVAQRGGELLGVLTHQHSEGYADTLWLAVPPMCDDFVVQSLLQHARQAISYRRPLNLNFPVGLAAQAIQSAGFHAQQTLVWMEYRL